MTVFKQASWLPLVEKQMVSEGSRDTEDWSNDAENSALPTQEYIFILKIYSNRKQVF